MFPDRRSCETMFIMGAYDHVQTCCFRLKVSKKLNIFDSLISFQCYILTKHDLAELGKGRAYVLGS